MGVCGFDQWRGNVRAWVRQADPDREDLRQFVQTWAETWPDEMKTTRDLLGLAQQLNVFTSIQMAKTDAGKLVSFSKKVLRRNQDAPVDRWIIRVSGSGSNSLYHLEEL